MAQEFKPNDILVRQLVPTEARVAFIHPYDKSFIAAAKAMKVRGLLAFADNPIKVEGRNYKAWYADISKLDEKTYAAYKMLVNDFYAGEEKATFDRLFTGFDLNKITPSVHNPNRFMEADREAVDSLIEKYKNTTSPLIFYGSKHQAEGVVLMRKSLVIPDGRKGCILGDVPGLGKSRTAVVAAIEEGKKNILVVTTKSAKRGVWPKQIRMVDPKATIAFADHKHWGERAQWTIVHWGNLKDMPDRFFEDARTFDLIILDESHAVSNEKSLRSQAAARACESIPSIWMLTGTPMTKRPISLIHPLKVLHHPLVKDKAAEWHFLNRYCGGKDERTGYYDFRQAKNLDELHVLLRDVLIRRENTNLPPLILQDVTVPLSDKERHYYDTAWDRWVGDPANLGKLESPGFPLEMVQKTILRSAVAMAKVPTGIDKAQEILDAGNKVVIFTNSTEVWEAYHRYFKDIAVGIQGSTSEQARADAEERFQTDPEIKVFVGNIRAAGEAITLTAAHYVIFNDITWLPGDQMQACRRVNRGGSTETAFAIFLLAEDTVDQEGYADFVKYSEKIKTVVNHREDGTLETPAPESLKEGTTRKSKTPPGLKLACGIEGLKPLLALRDEDKLSLRDAETCDSLSNYAADKGGLTAKQLGLVNILVRRYTKG